MARILIADDALFMRTVVKKALTSGGHEVVGEAENGRKAVEMMTALNPDLILMDITMPEMDGLAALAEIMQTNPAMRVIMCTALGQQDKVRQALTTGAKDYVVKPFDPTKLVETVNRVLSA
jgi:two-component system chemotaxis response regulator CheY